MDIEEGAKPHLLGMYEESAVEPLVDWTEAKVWPGSYSVEPWLFSGAMEHGSLQLVDQRPYFFFPFSKP